MEIYFRHNIKKKTNKITKKTSFQIIALLVSQTIGKLDKINC